MGSMSASDSESDGSDSEADDLDDDKGKSSDKLEREGHPKGPKPPSKKVSAHVEVSSTEPSSGSGRSRRQIQFDQLMVEIKECEQ